MWKRIKEWLFGKKKKIVSTDYSITVSGTADGINYKEINPIVDGPSTTHSHSFKRIKTARFKCKACRKTIARLKNQHLGKVSEYDAITDGHFQLVKNQHNKNRLNPFSLSFSGCHHCNSKEQLDYEVEWQD